VVPAAHKGSPGGRDEEALLVATGEITKTAGSALAFKMHVLLIEQQLLQTNYFTYLRLRANPFT
jgi:hypothetical protein